MKFLIAYATSEGQTRKIARHVADTLADRGHAIELLSCTDASGIDLDRFDAAILADSIHASRYQRELATFATQSAGKLKEMATLFLSISLAAAGHDSDDWHGLEQVVSEFERATGFRPDRVAQIAGAYLPSKYDILRRLAMRRIISAKDREIDLNADKEFTDWPDLERKVGDWVSSIQAKAPAEAV